MNDWEAWKLPLLALGVVLELAGLGLVAIENFDIRRAIRSRNARVHVKTLSANIRGQGNVTVGTEGEPPTLEQRIAEVERRISEHKNEVDARLVALGDQLRREQHDAVGSVQQDLEFQVGDLRRVLKETVEPTKQRWTGLVLFAVGLLLQTGAGLIP